MSNSEQSSAGSPLPQSRSDLAAPIHNESPLSVEAMQQLVSQHAQLEAEVKTLSEAYKNLQASLDHYAKLFRNAPVRQYTINSVGQITEANNKFASVLAVPLEQLIDQPFVNFVLTEDRQVFREIYQRLEVSGEPQAGDLQLVLQDGLPFWVQIMLVPAVNVKDSPYTQIAVTGITRRKRDEQSREDKLVLMRSVRDPHRKQIALLDKQGAIVEVNKTWRHHALENGDSKADAESRAAEALRRSERRLSELINTIDGIVWEAELPAYRVMFVSIQAQRFLGYPVGNWIDDPDFWEKRIHPEDRNVAVTSRKAHTFAGRRHRLQYRMIAADGRIVWVDDLVTVSIKDGRPDRLFGVMVDITARVQAEAEREEARLRLEKIASRVPGTLYQLKMDPDGRLSFPYVSNRLHDILGISPESVREDVAPLFALLQPNDRAMLMTAIHEGAKDLTSRSREIRIRYPDGSMHWIATHSLLEREADGSTLWYGILMDISARKEMEMALQTRERELLLIANLIPGPVARVSRDLRYLFVNEFYETLFCKPRDWFLGRLVREVLDEAHFQEVLRYAQRALEGESITFERETAPVLGARNFLVHFLPDRDEHGHVVGLVIVGLDITARKQAEAELQQRESYQRAVLDNFPYLVWLKDRDSRFLSVNKAFAQAVGNPSPESLIGKTDFDVWPRELAKSYRADDRAVLTSGQPKNVEEPIDINGHRVWFETFKSPVTMDGQVIGSVGFARNITERKEFQDQIERHRDHLEELVLARTAELAAARDAAETTNHAKTAFLANMSHELRTPLHGIMGMTQLALKRATDPQQIDFLNKSVGASKHLLEVINDILDIARIESDHLTLDVREFSLSQLLEEVLQIQETAAAAKDLRLVLQIVGSFSDRLYGDVVRLKQIMLNYLGNAIKFSEQGVVTVRASGSEDDRHSVWLRFEVVDQGIGISADQQQRLFQPFAQADESTTRKYGGTGLGLAICKRLAKLMNGDVGVESALGVGSTFWMNVRLRRCDQPQQPDGSARAGSARDVLVERFAGTAVLVAEDEALNQEVIRYQLEDAGLTVDVVSDGQQALEQAGTGHYALVLMDVQMPHMDGLEATRALRSSPASAFIPIVALTANAFDDDRRKCLDAGMNDYLRKPVDPDLLCETVLKWLQRRVE